MTQPVSIKEVFSNYSHNPEALQACREVMDIVESTVNEIIAKSKETKEAKRRVTDKEHNTVAKAPKAATKPKSPYFQIINATPAILQPDLSTTWELIFADAGEIAINTITPSTEDGSSLGACLEYLVENHRKPLEEKFPNHIPDILKALYLLSTHCLFDCVSEIVRVQTAAKPA